MSQVMDDIKPYITKHFMAQSTVLERDIAAICQILLPLAPGRGARRQPGVSEAHPRGDKEPVSPTGDRAIQEPVLSASEIGRHKSPY